MEVRTELRIVFLQEARDYSTPSRTTPAFLKGGTEVYLSCSSRQTRYFCLTMTFCCRVGSALNYWLTTNPSFLAYPWTRWNRLRNRRRWEICRRILISPHS